MTSAAPAVPRNASAHGGWWLAAAAVLFAPRLLHLTGPLDDPHSWRQCDTAYYSLDFARRGIDLLHPAVCWLGAHRTLIFEFPLPEAISALLQRTLGLGLMADRLVALGFYVVATIYFHAALRRFAAPRTAWLATLAWLALPLGQFYSRAAHVDFAATAGAHALLYHGMRAARERSPLHAAAAAAGGTLAALIKAPYLLPLLGPLGLAALSAAGAAGLGLLGAALAVTIVGFKLWRGHVDLVNAQAPDWFFLPGYYKEVNPNWWYFGEWSQRLDAKNWMTVLRRVVREVLSSPGAVVAFASPLARRAVVGGGQRFGPWSLALAWIAGVLAYVVVFFPLNVIHDYYQIPFLAPAALLIALGAEAMLALVPPIAVLFLLLCAVLMTSFVPPRLGYYRVDWLRVEAGARIRERVPAADLVVACDHASGYSDPRLLARADRLGWPLAIPDLTPDRLAKLRALNARWVAIVTSPAHPELRAPEFLAPARVADVPLAHEGKALGRLELFDLARIGAATGVTPAEPPARP